MTLDKWTTGDTITETNINKRGLRRGTTTDRDAIAGSELVVGDHFFNETENCDQTLYAESPNKWISDRVLISADGTEVTVTGSTATQRKNTSFIKSTIDGYAGNRIFITAEIKTSNGGTTGNFRVRLNGSGSDSLVLTTTSTSYEIVTGSFSIASQTDDTRHTLEFFMDDGAGDTISNRELEVYGV